MLRSRVWGLTALTAGVLISGGWAADPPSPESKPWYGRIMGGTEAKKTPPAAATPASPSDKTFADVPARPPVVNGPLDASAMAEAVKAEWDAWQRRVDVCLKLREIAAKSNDDRLFEQAEQLEKQATQLRDQRLSRLGVKSDLRKLPEGAEIRPSAAPVVTPPTPVEPSEPRTFREVKP